LIDHLPVLPEEILEYLQIHPNGIYVDATVGLGGHATEILKRLRPGGRLICIDQDAETLAITSKRIMEERITFLKGNFENMTTLLADVGIEWVDGILMDLGLSSFQLLSSTRGFSFRSSAPLDMRMDRSSETTAADIVNHASEKDLANIIYEYGEERYSRRIARAIVRGRPLRTCKELADLIESATKRRGKIHPATRTFQALRIAVNRELDVLQKALESAASLLFPEGRLCVISYHSLEDRIVKNSFRTMKGQGIFKLITSKPVTPGREEVLQNPRSRSAKLRVAEKLRQPEKDV